MIKKQLLNKHTITANDIKQRHPRYLTCETDKMYADLANEIFDLLHEDLSFMPPEQIRNACISMALYFEDIHSELRLFETFTYIHRKMFGCYLPFYATTDKNDPDAELDAIRFMLWHSCVAERDGMVLNPSNKGIKELASILLNFWNEKKSEILPNVELADYIYSEDTQTDANEVKTVLVWLSRYCPLGRWYTNSTDAIKPSDLKQMTTDKSLATYANDCYILSEQRVWPLSLAPQHIYAEMIRIEMDDPNDELAEAIDRITFKHFSVHELVGHDNNSISVKDYLGDVVRISNSDFSGDVKKYIKQNTHLAASFICMNGVWKLNGPCLWSKPRKKEIEEHLEELRQHHHYMNDFRGQYDEFISAHNGKRIYFFKNFKKYAKWLKEELQLDYEDFPLDEEYKNEPNAIFFEDNGQMTTCFNARCIKHPDNPYYSSSEAEENGLGFVGMRSSCTPNMLFYLIEHDLLPDVMLNDIRGRKYGRKLTQDNMEFIARCLRRDITTEKVVRQRTTYNEEAETEDVTKRYGTKHSYDKFVELIAAEKSIRSKANKEWEVMKANHTTTIIRDVKKRLDHEMATRDLYEAHLSLDSKQIQVASLVPFVGKEKAPAASALLYNIVGEGQTTNNLRKFVQDIVKMGGLDKLAEMLSQNTNDKPE